MTTSNNSLIFVGFLLSLCLVCSLKEGYAFEGKQESYLTHTIQLSSLFPSSVCNHSTKANERKSTLKIVDKYGPCFQPNQDKEKPSPDILRIDQSRVDFIQSKLSKNTTHHRNMKELDAAQIPVIDGSSFRTQNFLVKVGFGTPKVEVSLVIDTGSDITWTQCKPCKNCYKQKENKFDRRASSTYATIPCADALCDIAPHADNVKCRKLDCVYKIKYEGGPSSEGYFAKETLTLTSSEVLTDYKFGCGFDQQGNYSRQAGIMGLDRSQVSIVSQTASKYSRIFSYCLPSSSSNTGHLTFGSHSLPQAIKYTKLITTHSTLYGLGLIGLGLGGKKLSIPESVFKQSGTVIDSGTPLTYLPPTAYTALETAFRDAMSKYPKAPASSDLDVCYDVSKDPQFTVPQFDFYFEDGTQVTIPDKGSIHVYSTSQVCLAMVANQDAKEYTIIGNVAQKTMEVVYDIPGNRIGFALKGCN
ncbi:hypothetical protein ACOSP7_007995 [Xanthoceras sorbifolium]